MVTNIRRHCGLVEVSIDGFSQGNTTGESLRHSHLPLSTEKLHSTGWQFTNQCLSSYFEEVLNIPLPIYGSGLVVEPVEQTGER